MLVNVNTQPWTPNCNQNNKFIWKRRGIIIIMNADADAHADADADADAVSNG